MADQVQSHHTIKKEPKFCRCRVCHEHFYGETIEEAGNEPGLAWGNEPGQSCVIALIMKQRRPDTLNRIRDSHCPDCGAHIDGIGMSG